MATKKEKLFKKITDLLELKRTEFPDNCSGISFPTNDTFERWSISRLDCCYVALLKTYNMLIQQKENKLKLNTEQLVDLYKRHGSVEEVTASQTELEICSSMLSIQIDCHSEHRVPSAHIPSDTCKSFL